MPAFKDLTSLIFGRLIVVKRAENINGRVAWLCNCSCGKSTIVISKTLLNGSCKSCGCLKRDRGINNKYSQKYNTYDLSGEYGIGYLNDNNEFYFDKKNYNKIKNYYWTIKDGYIVTVSLRKKIGKRIAMHQLLFGYNSDHINGIRNDNRNLNIRVVTRSQNCMNTKIYKNNSTGVKGVNFNSKKNTYKAVIQKEGNSYQLITTSDKNIAIKYREIAELYLFNDYSRRYYELKDKYKNLNIIDFIKTYMPKILNINR